MRERRGPGVAERKMAVPAGPRLVGGARLDGRVGTNALTPFWRCRGPPPRPRAPARPARAPAQEWKLPFPPEGGGAVRGPGEVGEFAGGGDPGPALPF